MEEKRETRLVEQIFYSNEFKRRVVDEYLRTGCTKMGIQRAYGIKGKSAIAKWLNTFGLTDPYKKGIKFDHILKPVLKKELNNVPANDSVEELKKQLAEAKRQLEDEKIRSAAYYRMIELAEKDYNLPIRKKSDTK